ncbi:MAG: nicotinamide-nucleotide amidohydrolase family protein [bacterium]
MKSQVAELITIGNEILDGRVIDTNRSYLGRELKALGFEVRYAQSVDDNLARIVSAFELASKRSDVVFCTGGLGPTSDDLTAEAFSQFAKVPFEMNAVAEKFVRQVLASRNREPNESQLKQAKLPQGCEVIENSVGTAPAFSCLINSQNKKCEFYFFPGVPRELKAIFEGNVRKKFLSSSFRTYTWATCFTAESDLQEKLKFLEPGLSPLKLGFRTHFPENFVSLMGNVQDAQGEVLWADSLKKIDQVLAPLTYQKGEVLPTLEGKIITELEKKKTRLLLVESCTGGLLSSLLTDVAGASSVLWGSQVCYANEEKIRLGVDPEILKKFGAVSEECTKSLVENALLRLCKDSVKDSRFLVSLSTTGIAGPSGGTDEKPVGLCWLGLAIQDQESKKIQVFTEKVLASKFYDRSMMKLYFAKKALHFLRANFLNFTF